MTRRLPTLDSPELRKARGAFFTPPEICRYIADWAIRTGDDAVLEPSCGEAAFLVAAAERLATLPASRDQRSLRGFELHEPTARDARAQLHGLGINVGIEVADFFDVQPTGDIDAVIGNPPYVRYQGFAGAERSRAQASALRAGVRLSALASSWAAFTVHSALFLKAGGRLALVLPAELLSTNYASEVRAFLMRRFASVRLVLFTERVFPGVLEEVVLLLAEGEGPTDHCELHQFRDAGGLAGGAQRISRWHPSNPLAKWTPALLEPTALTVYRGLSDSEAFTTLETWGDVTLGAVTGANHYFALTQDQVVALGLSEEEVLPLSPPGSRHLRGLGFSLSEWEALRRAGRRVWLFRPTAQPTAPATAYIGTGAEAGVNRAYKCRIRDPWWRTPVVPPPDFFVTYMNADTPRLVANEAGVHHLNSVHGLYLSEDQDREIASLLPIASLNSLTLLGAETVGRAYGGGMLKLEPREADVLPVPGAPAVERGASELRSIRASVCAALSERNLPGAVAIVDRAFLCGSLDVPETDIRQLADARRELADRRRARGRARSTP